MDKKKSKLVRDLKAFKRKNNLEEMYLFGSRATGKAHRWSDIDLIIVSKRFMGKGLLERAPPLYMEWRLNQPVDMLCYTPGEFKKLKKQVSIVSEAIRHGIKI